VSALGGTGGKRLLQLTASVIVSGLAASRLGAQSQQQTLPTFGSNAGVKLYRIAGALTDSVSGKPVDGATMELSTTTAARQIVQTTKTNADGQFALDPMPAGKYSLVAMRRGYPSEAFDEHEEFSSAIVTGEGQDTEHIPFLLDPGGVIRGHVTDDAGEPVVGAHVVVKHWTRWGGLGDQIVNDIELESDDQGEFEGWNFSPGQYLLAVKADPWFAIHPSRSEREALSSDEQRAAVAALDVAYPLTYYDGTTDEKSASPIWLASGETVEVNFALHAAPAVHLTLREPQDGDQISRWAFVTQTIFGGDVPAGTLTTRTDTNEPTTLEYAVAPGQYEVGAGTPPRIMEIEATGDQEVALASGMATVEKSLKVRMADGSPLPKALDIVLLSVDLPGHELKARVDEKSEAHFPSIPPGEWIALAESEGMALAVVAVESGSKTIADSRIDPAGQPMGMTLELAQGKTRIEGFTSKNGKGEAGVMIVLVPKDPAANLAEFRRDQSDSDGSFMLPGVIPGEYTLVAIEDGWGLDWAKPDVIRHYLAGGMAIRVSEMTGPLIQLSAPAAVQPR
jgi:hypothetical protein